MAKPRVGDLDISIAESEAGAVFSPDRTWRYLLWRNFEFGEGTVFLIGLNPSTADETYNDRTIGRCIGFARSWGFRRLVVANLFAYCATKPTDLKRAVDPIGSANDQWLRSISRQADVTVAAWGNDGRWVDRDAAVLPLLVLPKCLGVTSVGAPRHPLYVRGDQPLIEFR